MRLRHVVFFINAVFDCSKVWVRVLFAQDMYVEMLCHQEGTLLFERQRASRHRL